MRIPCIGMIVPPAAGQVPPEAARMYPEGVRFLAAGLGLERLTPEGYDRVIDRVGPLAAELAGRGADAVVLMGTSLSFYRGPAANRDLIGIMEQAGGRPATTMSSAVRDALGALGAKRIAVATAYVDAVNRPLVAFLEDAGFAVAGLESLGIAEVTRVPSVDEGMLLALGLRAAAAAKDPDALFISCGGLHTLDVTRVLEERTGLPVVSSATAGAWAAMRLIGANSRVEGYGRLLGAGEVAQFG